MLGAVRAFFTERGVYEVDIPILSKSASIDAHIDLMETSPTRNEKRFLHSSPEYGMKRLLAEGSGDIFQLSHVFRYGDKGHLHSPEFMMIEWYREGFSFEIFLEECAELCHLFLPNLPVEVVSYKEVFQKHLGFDPLTVSTSFLQEKGSKYLSLSILKTLSRDDLLSLLLSHEIEPLLGQNSLLFLKYFPPSQAALAKTVEVDGQWVAERCEIYHRGIELGNGYHELTDPNEQRSRLHEQNSIRALMGKEKLPIDERFLAALEKGLPDTCGMAIGFDRLLMLKLGATTIHSITALPWDAT